MKSFSNLLLEKEELEQQKRKKVKKTNKPFKSEVDVTTTNKPADVQGRIDATDTKKGGYSRVDDSLDVKKPSGRTKLGNETVGGEVKIINPRDPNKPRVPDPKKGELGQLYTNKTKSDPQRGGSVRTTDKINAKLRAQRKARINPLTGKATPKGVENFAQNRGGYGRGRKLTGPEWEKISGDAKRIASNPSSKEYKKIEAEINKSDYAGKRANTLTKNQEAKIKKDLRKSKTINAKANVIQPKVFDAKATRATAVDGKKAYDVWKPIRTKIKSTSKQKLKNKGIKQSEVSKIIAKQNKAYNANRVSSSTTKPVTPKSTSPVATLTKTTKPPFSSFAALSKDAELNNQISSRRSATTNQLDRLAKEYDLGNDSNTGRGADTQNKPVNPKKTPTSSKNIKIDSKYTPPKTSKPSIKIDTPKPPKLDKVTSSQTAFVEPPKPPKKGPGLTITKQGKNYKDFMKSAADADVKGLVKNKAKLLRPKGLVNKALKGSSKVLGRLTGPAFAVWDAADAYKGYRSKGHGKTGSAVRGAVKAGSYWGGFSKGAATGLALTAAIPVPGARLVGSAVGGLIGGATASKLSDTAINAYDKVFKPKKVATKYQNPDYVKGVVKQKKDKKPVTGLSLGVSDKQWKARFGEEYVQERFRSQAIQTYLKNKAGQQDLINKANKFKQENPGTDFSKGAAMSNPNLTPSSSFNNNSTQKPVPTQTTQKPVPTQTTQARSLGPTQQAASNIDAMRSPASGSRQVKPGLIGKLLPNHPGNTGGGGSTPQAKPVVPQAQAKPAVPSQQARPGRTVGAPQGTGRPGAMVRVGSAINAVRSALSNKGPIQGRQTGAQRRVAQSQVRANRPAPVTPTRPIRGQGNRPIAGNQNRQGGTTPVAKPVTQAPVAKPVQAAPVAKPAPQLTGAQRAQQMAKQRIAQGRNTVTGELKSKPKVRKIASPMDMDY